MVTTLERLRKFFESKQGRAAAFVIVLIGVCLAVFSAVKNLGPSDAVKLSRERVFVDAESGKGFEYTLREGDHIPVESPFTGKKTGFPAELCYWTADGKIKSEPTYVHLVGLEPQFCPDCHRLVRPYNPVPQSGDKPPPTETEFKSGRR